MGQWATRHQGAPGASGAPRWVVGPMGLPCGASLVPKLSSGPKKLSKKFCDIWTLSSTDILRSKKLAKTATRTGHYVNRLVPKNDIKLL